MAPVMIMWAAVATTQRLSHRQRNCFGKYSIASNEFQQEMGTRGRLP
jgi:hypothetical protein